MSVLICNNTLEISGETAALVVAPRHLKRGRVVVGRDLGVRVCPVGTVWVSSFNILQRSSCMQFSSLAPPGHRRASALQLLLLFPVHI